MLYAPTNLSSTLGCPPSASSVAATQLRSAPVVEVAPRCRLRLRLGLPEHYVTTHHSSVAASFQKNWSLVC
jgi:hypothetical protein